jgi:hypothetical protein
MSGINIPKLNVPVGIYLMSLIAIGAAEYYDLKITLYLGIASGVASLAAIIYTLPSYVRRYLKKEDK